MPRCDTCGNDYDGTFELRMGDRTFTFDCFECAIHKLAPVCRHCGCRIVGHGVEERGLIFCGANCARQMGTTDLRDRGDAVSTIEIPRYP